jgi:hypothetical protein
MDLIELEIFFLFVHYQRVWTFSMLRGVRAAQGERAPAITVIFSFF